MLGGIVEKRAQAGTPRATASAHGSARSKSLFAQQFDQTHGQKESARGMPAAPQLVPAEPATAFAFAARTVLASASRAVVGENEKDRLSIHQESLARLARLRRSPAASHVMARRDERGRAGIGARGNQGYAVQGEPKLLV